MKAHRLDLLSGFFGIIFLSLGVTILAGRGEVSLRYLSVLGPVLVVAFGLVLVAAALRRQPKSPPPAEEPRPSYSYASATAPLQHPAVADDVEEAVPEEPAGED